MYKKILLATDGSEDANKAAKHAIWIAKSSNAELTVLHVLETSKLPEIETITTESALRDLLTQEAKRVFSNVSNIIKSSDCHVKVNYKRESGNPADMIIKTVEKEKIELVVMGTAGKHGLSRFWLGSVAENVVRYAPCPVLVVK
ncbi:MAG: universal stress protein [Methanobacteriaceae archaeon]|jgi:nucleotide-binding universal stress UspA family protein